MYTALTSRESADYYSVAIKSQFGVGGLSGCLEGHSTRQLVGSIEMDGALKVESASLVWKCSSKKPWSWNKSDPLQNIDTGTNFPIDSSELEEGFSAFMRTKHC